MLTVCKARAVLSATKMTDAQRLAFLNCVYELDTEGLHENVRAQFATLRRIRECTENGKVAVVEGGMDCDCVRYEGRVHIFDADPKLFWDQLDRMYYNAEGPIHWSIFRPSAVEEVQYSSRDLALEAFENGHPYHVG